jgi:hypothetical protein
MVDKLKQVVEALNCRRNDVCLFAVLKMDDLIDKWSVVASGPWADDSRQRRAVFDEILSIMNEKMGEQELDSFARIGVLPLNDHLIQELMKFKKDTVIEDQKINGNFVYKGYVLASQVGGENSVCSAAPVV